MELGENYQDHNCACANSTGAIWTLSVFTQFLLRFIASRVIEEYCTDLYETYLELCSLDSRAREQTISGGERGRWRSPPGPPPPTDCEDAHESQDEAAEADGVASLLAGLEGGGISGSVAEVHTPKYFGDISGRPSLSGLRRPSLMRIVAAVISNINF